MKYELLGKIVEVTKGKKHNPIDLPPGKNSKRIIGITDLRNDINIVFTDDKVGVQALENDILLAWDGANAGTIGFGKRGFIGSTISRLRFKDALKYNTAFIGKLLQSHFNYLQSTSTGATIPHINRSALDSIRVPVFSVHDQIRIASILTQAEELIAKRKESIKALDELVKSTFLEMFGDPVWNKKGWETLPMTKIGRFTSGGTPSKERNDFWDGDFPWVSPKDMKVPYIAKAQDHISQKVFEETNLKRIAIGHLLIVVRGMILIHTFPTAINTVEVAINQDMKAILPIKDVSVLYLKHCLDNMERQILKIITTAGHGTKKFDTDSMIKVIIPIPAPHLQSQFAAIVEKAESLKAKYTQSLAELENLYGSLSQRAFKGELDLSRVKAERIIARII